MLAKRKITTGFRANEFTKWIQSSRYGSILQEFYSKMDYYDLEEVDTALENYFNERHIQTTVRFDE